MSARQLESVRDRGGVRVSDGMGKEALAEAAR